MDEKEESSSSEYSYREDEADTTSHHINTDLPDSPAPERIRKVMLHFFFSLVIFLAFLHPFEVEQLQNIFF